MIRAMRSLPVPVAPEIITEALLVAARPTNFFHFAHGRAGAEQAYFMEFAGGGAGLGPCQSAGDDRFEVVAIGGLDHMVEGAELDGFDSVIEVGN